MSFRVTWPQQTAAGMPPEDYLTESRANVRARELVAQGAPHAVVFEVSDEEMSA